MLGRRKEEVILMTTNTGNMIKLYEKQNRVTFWKISGLSISSGCMLITGTPVLIVHLSIKSGYVSLNICMAIHENKPIRY